jgi:stage III sporulation protein AC
VRDIRGDNAYLNIARSEMELELIFKIAAVGIIVAVLVQLLKRAERDEQAMMTTLAGLIVVLMMIIQRIAELFDTVKTLFGF